MYYISCFLFFSIFGFIFENIIFLVFNMNIESGFLFGPWTIIYGFGFLIINYIFNILKNIFKNQFLIFFLLFIFSFFSLSFLEFIGGFLIEKLFGIVWWNYENYFLHIGKYVCVWVSLIWTFLALFNIIVVKSVFNIFLNYIPKFIIIVLFVILIIDFILSTILHIIL